MWTLEPPLRSSVARLVTLHPGTTVSKLCLKVTRSHCPARAAKFRPQAPPCPLPRDRASAATTLPTQKGSQVLPPRGVTAQDPRKHSKASAVWASARLFLQPDSTLPPFHSYPQTHSKNWEGGRGGERVCFLHTTVSYFLSCSVYQNFTRQCGDQRWSFHSGSQPGVILLFLGGLARSRDISGCHA